MKKILIAIIAIFVFVEANSQVKDPVSFQYQANKRAPGIYEIVITVFKYDLVVFF